MSAYERRQEAKRKARALEPRLVYQVAPASGLWLITCRREHSSSCAIPINFAPSQREAVDRARRIAWSVHNNGWRSQLVVHGKDGRIRYEHTYGADPERSKG